jgi:predicted metal-dependent hydrolase
VRTLSAIPDPAGQRGLFEEAADRELAQQPTPPRDFKHPQATNEFELADRVVAYVLRRARRRSIGMVVTPEGLKVSAPRWVSVSDIEAALRDKARWILSKLVEQRDRAARSVAARIDWRTGATLPFLGDEITVVLGRGAVRSASLVHVDGVAQLHIGLPPDAAPDRVARAVQKWMRIEAMKIFDARCRVYMERMGVRLRRLSLSSARTRWGSASSTGSIRLHWRLAHFPLSTIDYVVVHELAHLREMNHSPRFWAIVADILPGYEAARAELKSRVLPVLD